MPSFRRPAFFAVLLLSASALGQPAPAWVEVASVEGRFTARFPGAPKQQTQTIRTADGKLDGRVWTLEAAGAFYAVAYVDHPKEKLAGKSADEHLDGARDRAVADIKGKLLSESRINLAGFPGRELRIDAPGDHTATLRIFLAKERVYQAIVLSKKVRRSVENEKTFLESFQIR